MDFSNSSFHMFDKNGSNTQIRQSELVILICNKVITPLCFDPSDLGPSFRWSYCTDLFFFLIIEEIHSSPACSRNELYFVNL
jgi:hypothetical protein